MKKIADMRRGKMLAQGGRCYYCDLPMWDQRLAVETHPQTEGKHPSKALLCTAEHLNPRSEGGGNGADNIVAACWFCNTTRHRRKRPQSPQQFKTHVMKRMRQGRWLRATVQQHLL